MTTDVDVIDRLARIDVKLDQLLARNDDHEMRIRRLERVVWLASGFALSDGRSGRRADLQLRVGEANREAGRYRAGLPDS